MSILSSVSTFLVRQWYNSLKDKTAYRKETKEVVDIAVGLYDEGESEKSLRMFLSLAKQIDCKNFHKFGFWGPFRIRNVEAREQYNRVCLYLAKIYHERNEYTQVQFWANNLSFIRNFSVSDWKLLLNDTDYTELKEFFDQCDLDTDTLADVYSDYATRPCD